MRKPRSENAIDYSQMAFPKGNVRLQAKELGELRKAVLKRDKMRCQECGEAVSDRYPAWHPRKAEMAHIRSRGAGGSDNLANLKLLCHECHQRQHNQGHS